MTIDDYMFQLSYVVIQRRKKLAMYTKKKINVKKRPKQRRKKEVGKTGIEKKRKDESMHAKFSTFF